SAEEGVRPVVQVIDESNNEILYTIRAQGNSFQPYVYSAGPFTVKVGDGKLNGGERKHLQPMKQQGENVIKLPLP
ncbi:hypothetical protein N8553_04595, partial [bacterium]|nr:hypothetical protein [bacterium]